jgi:hypothetical protein
MMRSDYWLQQRLRADTAMPLNSQESRRIEAVLTQAGSAVGSIRFAI